MVPLIYNIVCRTIIFNIKTFCKAIVSLISEPQKATFLLLLVYMFTI